jgi:hypothetical protein
MDVKHSADFREPGLLAPGVSGREANDRSKPGRRCHLCPTTTVKDRLRNRCSASSRLRFAACANDGRLPRGRATRP